MAKYDEADGVWRTIGGRRVFIKNGQSLASAMIESGKFKKGGMREAYRKEKEKIDKLKEESFKSGKEGKKAYDEYKKAEKDLREANQAPKENNKNIDDEIKQMYKDTWAGKNSYKELNDKLNDLKEEGKISQGKLRSLQESASNEIRNKETNLKSEKNGIETISKEEYDKMPKDYKGTLKELVDTAEFRGENKEQLRQQYEKMGFDVDNDKTILKYENGGTVLKPVKISDNNEKEKQQTFTQKTDMYGGTREYSKEELDRMEEHGAKPMEHSYTGGGWEGTKYDSNLSTKDIAKNINDYAKNEFPDVKLSRKTDYNGIDINIMSSEKDLYKSASDIDNMSNEQISATIRDSVGGYSRFDDWLNDNNKKSANGTYTVNEQKEYLKSELQSYKNRKGDRVTGNEWYLSDYGQKVVSGLNKEMNSYNYDDSDGMVDYFDTNFYGYVQIGKWDKPYEVTSKQTSGNQIANSLRQRAYNKYLKEHPGSQMSFEDFLKKQ